MPRPRAAARATFHHGALRDGLVERLLAVLDEEGLEGVGVRRLARDLGVDPAAVYRHFRDAEGLQAAARQACFATFADAMERAAAPREGESPSDALLRTGQAYVRHALAHPHRYRLMFRTAPTGAPGRSARGHTAWEVFVDVVRRARGVGVSEQAVAVDARTAWALVHGVASLLLDGPLSDLDRAGRDALVARSLAMVVASLAPMRKR